MLVTQSLAKLDAVHVPRCDRVPHCQALIEPKVVLAAVRQWLGAGSSRAR